MVHGKRGKATTQREREIITARLFRRDAAKDIAHDLNVSERSIRRMSKSLREHGTPIPPRDPKPRGRHQLLSTQEHDALAEYVSKYPIALRVDMVQFVKDNFEKDVTEATVGRAIKRMGFSQIIIQRGERARRHDLPPEAEHVHRIAAEAIDEQRRINAEHKAQSAKEAKVTPGGPRKGTCAWVRLPPGADTGFNPRIPRMKLLRELIAQHALEEQEEQESQEAQERLQANTFASRGLFGRLFGQRYPPNRGIPDHHGELEGKAALEEKEAMEHDQALDEQRVLERQRGLEDGILEASKSVADLPSLPGFITLSNIPEPEYISPYG